MYQLTLCAKPILSWSHYVNLTPGPMPGTWTQWARSHNVSQPPYLSRDTMDRVTCFIPVLLCRPNPNPLAWDLDMMGLITHFVQISLCRPNPYSKP